MNECEERKTVTKLRTAQLLSAGMLALLVALPAVARAADESKTPAKTSAKAPATASGSDEFFIVSSVDLNKHQLLLKHPTEVTELMTVNDATVFVDDQGHRLQFNDLRAGDTVYVTYTTPREGSPLALRIRRAPMTVEELHKRYLQGVS
jgi:hypothetical protein